MEDPDSLWEFEVVSRLDFDPGNHGKRKCTITRDELKRRISPPENLGHSVHAILAFLRVAKNKTTVNLVRDIVDKLGCVDEKAAIVRSAFTLMPEGNLQLSSKLVHIGIIDDLRSSQKSC